MNSIPSWISGADTELGLAQNQAVALTLDDHRMMISRTHLVERLHEACSAVNLQAGEGTVYEQTFIQPQECLCSYIYKRKAIEFGMSLEIFPEGPTLTFWFVRPKRGAGLVERCFGYRLDDSRGVTHQILIRPTMAKDADVEQWFSYLLSGLHFSFKQKETPAPSQ